MSESPPFQKPGPEGRQEGVEGEEEKKKQQQCAPLLLNLRHTGCLFSLSPFPEDVLIHGASVAQGLVSGRTQTCPRNGSTGSPQAGWGGDLLKMATGRMMSNNVLFQMC